MSRHMPSCGSPADADGTKYHRLRGSGEGTAPIAAPPGGTRRGGQPHSGTRHAHGDPAAGQPCSTTHIRSHSRS